MVILVPLPWTQRYKVMCGAFHEDTLAETRELNALVGHRLVAVGGTCFETACAYGESENAIRRALIERYPCEGFTSVTKNAAWLGARSSCGEAANGRFRWPMEGGNMDTSECRAWYEGDPILEDYHDNEWCKISHDDRFLFEMLSLEGASVGLSWKTIMHKREAYKAAFHDFDIDSCATMPDEELEGLLHNPGIIRNRRKVFSVRGNARVVKSIQSEFGSFDAYVWGFADGKTVDGQWETTADIPTESDASRAMSADMRRRGISFVGPVITYSFMQSIGMVNDHLRDCAHR